MRLKKYILVSMVLICLGTIFYFSNQIGNKSEKMSDVVTLKIIAGVKKVTGKEISKKEMEKIVKDMRTYIRKTAHFTIYLILGIFIYFTLKCYQIKHIVIYSLVFCFLYACSDEIHQLFVEARTGRLIDVFIDTVGALIGIIISLGISSLRKKKVGE